MSGTTYNKTSCRACGTAFSVAKTCMHCSEPVKWFCEKCGMADDSTHVHLTHMARIVESC